MFIRCMRKTFDEISPISPPEKKRWVSRADLMSWQIRKRWATNDNNDDNN